MVTVSKGKNTIVPALEKPATLDVVPADNFHSLEPQEVGTLAFEMADTYRAFIDYYRKFYKLDAAEATAKTEEFLATGSEDYEERVRHGPPQQASWHQLSHIAANDPQAVGERWSSIKSSALDELESGHQAAKVIEDLHSTPWDRAQFIALRHSLAAQWQPANGIEATLIDTMAQAQTLYMKWMKTAAQYIALEVREQHDKYDRDGYLHPPRVSSYQAMEQAAAMADRFNRLFLRTLRQLRDLRRYAPTVTIQSAGQVNIGGQQINVAGPADEPGG